MRTAAGTMTKMEFEVDDILPFVGEFSRFQIIVEVLLCFIMIPQTLQNLIMYFAALNSPWRCVANSTVCTFPQNRTFSAEDDGYTARCSMNRGGWQFVEPQDYSIMTQVCVPVNIWPKLSIPVKAFASIYVEAPALMHLIIALMHSFSALWWLYCLYWNRIPSLKRDADVKIRKKLPWSQLWTVQ